MVGRCSILAMAASLLLTPGTGGAQEPRPIAIIGTNDPTGEVLGRVRGVAADSFGRLAVLDAGEYRLLVVGPNGRLLQALGRQGSGPGEYQAPMAITFYNGRFIVADPATSRLTLYDATRTDSIRFVGSIATTVRVYGFCGASNSLYVLADGSQHFVHRLTLSDRAALIHQSFPAPRTRHRLGTALPPSFWVFGHLACDPVRGRVFHASDQLGEVTAYDLTGRELWFAAVPGFVPIEVEPLEHGWRQAVPAAGFFHAITAVRPRPSGSLDVQVAKLFPRTDPRRDTPILQVFSFELTARSSVSTTGALKFETETPLLLVCSRENPFPQVLLFDRRTVPADGCP